MTLDSRASRLSRTTPPASPSTQATARKARHAFWLLLALIVCLGFAIRVSRAALINPLVVHDDVRQHVFWVPRLHNPLLFANDWIADYYESQAPAGYRAVYWLFTLGMDAIQASKLLPLALTLILAAAAFWLGMALWRRLDAAALSTVLLVWTAWQYDDVASATPRAYALPLLTFQLAAVAAGRWRLALLVLPIQAVFYPLGCPLPVVTLGLWALWKAAERVGPWRRAEAVPPGAAGGIVPLRAGEGAAFLRVREGAGRQDDAGARGPDVSDAVVGGRTVAEIGAHSTTDTTAAVRTEERSGQRRAGDTGGAPPSFVAWCIKVLRRARPDLLWLAGATAVALLLVGLGQVDAARFGPTVSAAEARTLPEFQPGGRASYFVPGWYQFWLESSRSGFALGPKDELLGNVPVMVIPFSLGVLMGGWLLAGRLPGGRLGWLAAPPVPKSGVLLLVLLAASLLLFFAAHVLLFALYLPARYVQFSLPLVWALAGGLLWASIGDRLGAWRRAARHNWSGAPEETWGGLTVAELFVLAGMVLLTLHAPPPGEFYVVGRYPVIYAYLRQTPPDTVVAALPADSNILPLFGQRPILTSYEHALPYQPGYYLPLRARTEAFRAAYFAPTLQPLVSVIDQQRVGVVIADAEALERRRRAEREHPPALEKILERCGAIRERELVVLPVACIRAAAAGGSPQNEVGAPPRAMGARRP